jgi:acetoin:2,6-dichlorophenolindophenol oxidoreductase subunit beta
MRRLTYCKAIREAKQQLLSEDPRVFVIGQGLWSPWYVGGTMDGLEKEFGRSRIIDTPVSENATTAAAIGAAINGMRPIVVHPRMDFMVLATDPIVNQAANWCYMFAGQCNAPVVFRSIINRGGEQGAQHSQALQAFFLHVPGVKVVMPATPEDAKGLLVAAVYDGNPVVYIDDRWLYGEEGHVPEAKYATPLGQAAVRREGRDVTIVASSYMLPLSLTAAEMLQAENVSAEVVDLRTIKPWDKALVCESVAKTGRLVVADAAWATGGVSTEIVAVVAAREFHRLKSAPVRVCLPDAPAPTSKSLEAVYYPNAHSIVAAVRIAMDPDRSSPAPRPTSQTPGQIVID